MKKLTALLMALCAICAFAQEKQDAEKKIEIPADKEILQIKLPRPLFSGTPRELRTPNLEPTRKAGEKRPPIIVPKGLKNLAFKKEVTSSDSEPVVGELEFHSVRFRCRSARSAKAAAPLWHGNRRVADGRRECCHRGNRICIRPFSPLVGRLPFQDWRQ